MQIKHKTQKGKTIAALIVAAVLIIACSVTASAADGDIEITAPFGTSNYEFSVDLKIDEDTPYAGIQFSLTVSDENAISFDSFAQGEDIAGASEYPFHESHGEHVFGFWTLTNAFSGDLNVGKLNFTYSGSAPVTVKVTEAMAVRIDEENKKSTIQMLEGLPVIVVARDGNGENAGGGDTGDGSDTGDDSDTGDGSDTGGGSDTGDEDDSDNSVGAATGDGGGVASGVNSLGGTQSPAESVLNGNNVNTLDEDSVPLADAGVKSKYFTDVPQADWPWAVDAIDALYEAGIVKGTGERIFAPDASITRADAALMLVRAFELTANTDGGFSDVLPEHYFYEAVGVAKALGIAQGDGSSFNPNGLITRQDMMALVYRTLGVAKKPLPDSPETVLDAFADKASVSDYARKSVACLISSGIIVGDNGGISPLRNLSRAEMAVIMYRIIFP